MNTEIAWFVSISKLHRLVKIWEAYEDLQRQHGPQNITKKWQTENWEFQFYNFSFQQSYCGLSYVKL